VSILKIREKAVSGSVDGERGEGGPLGQLLIGTGATISIVCDDSRVADPRKPGL